LEPVLYNFLTGIRRNSRIFMIALALLVVFTGLWVFPGLFNPGFMESVTQAPFYTIESSYQYAAPVVNENPIWPVGTNLTGEPVYFLAVSPTIQGNFTLSIDASSADLLAAMDEEIVLLDQESNTTYWQKEIPAINYTAAWQGYPLVTDFTLNVSALNDEIGGIQKDLNFQQGTPAIEVVNTVVYSGRIDGLPVHETRTYTMPITASSGSYIIPDDLSQKEGVTRSRSELLVVSGLSIVQVLGIVAFLASLGLFFFVLAVRLGFKERDEAAVRALVHRGLHDRFADFISRGEFDGETGAIRLASLEDMVNTALDLNERVIFDEKPGIYFFIHNGIRYSYRPGEEGSAEQGSPGEEERPEGPGDQSVEE